MIKYLDYIAFMAGIGLITVGAMGHREIDNLVTQFLFSENYLSTVSIFFL